MIERETRKRSRKIERACDRWREINRESERERRRERGCVTDEGSLRESNTFISSMRSNETKSQDIFRGK